MVEAILRYHREPSNNSENTVFRVFRVFRVFSLFIYPVSEQR